MSVWNFNAGPAALAPVALEQMREQLTDYRGSGLSLLEMSHRGEIYGQVHRQALRLLRELLAVPEEFEVLFLGGGATLQFAMVPLNLLSPGGVAQFVLSGSWAKKAWDDAQRVGQADLLFDGRSCGFTRLPDALSIPQDGSAYLHLTSNETIDGVQWHRWPGKTEVPVVVDMSSDIASRELPWDHLDLVYAGAQKNLGPAGVTVVFARRSLLERCASGLPAYLSYENHVKQNSLYNTPPVFAVHMLLLQLQWLAEQGGIAAMEQASKRKAQSVYRVIDGSHDFYINPVLPAYRSRMNVVFRFADERLEHMFLAGVKDEGFVGLKGHRSKGGVRASLYNAVSEEAVSALVDFMERFLAHRS